MVSIRDSVISISPDSERFRLRPNMIKLRGDIIDELVATHGLECESEGTALRKNR